MTRFHFSRLYRNDPGWIGKRAYSPVQTDGLLLANNSQHCWMLHVPPFGHPVACCCFLSCCVLLRVVAQSLKPVEPLAMCKRTQQLSTLFGQQFWELWRPLVRSLTGYLNCSGREITYIFTSYIRDERFLTMKILTGTNNDSLSACVFC